MTLDLKKLHCGLISCPLNKAYQLMPEVEQILRTLPASVQQSPSQWLVDVKIHMLMPGQWPCIPNWHTDFCPRDEDGVRHPDQRDGKNKMYMWLSGPPFTEFMDGRKIEPETWTVFDQFDIHRGTAAIEHSWRMFIRVSPVDIAPSLPAEAWKRRHSQVYLDAGNFEW